MADAEARSSLLWCYSLQTLSSLLYSLGAVSTKLLSYDMDTWTIIVFRGFFGLVLCLAWALSSEYLIPPKVVVELPYSPRARRRTASITEMQEHLRPSEAEDWHDWSKRIVKSRGFFNGMRLTLGALGVLFYVTSMGLITVSEAFLVISVNPLLTAMLAPIFLTDTSWRMYDTVVSLICLLGIGFICPPTSFFDGTWTSEELEQVEGVSAAFGCALCMAGNCIAIRYYSNEPANNYIIWGMLGTLIIGLPYFIYEQVNSDFELLETATSSIDDWLLLFAMSAATWGASMSKTLSLQRSSGVFILVLNYTGAVFTVLLDVFVLGTSYSALSWAGMVIVLIACIASVVNRAPVTAVSLPNVVDCLAITGMEEEEPLLGLSPKETNTEPGDRVDYDPEACSIKTQSLLKDPVVPKDANLKSAEL